MKKDIIDLFAHILTGTDTNLTVSLENKEKQLEGIKCLNPRVGRFIENYEVPFLVESLRAKDEYFFRDFPRLIKFNATERKRLAAEIENHSHICPRCILKVSDDLEWEQQVNDAIEIYREDAGIISTRAKIGGNITEEKLRSNEVSSPLRGSNSEILPPAMKVH